MIKKTISLGNILNNPFKEDPHYTFLKFFKGLFNTYIINKKETIENGVKNYIFKVKKNHHIYDIIIDISIDHLIKIRITGYKTASLTTREINKAIDLFKKVIE